MQYKARATSTLRAQPRPYRRNDDFILGLESQRLANHLAGNLNWRKIAFRLMTLANGIIACSRSRLFIFHGSVQY